MCYASTQPTGCGKYLIPPLLPFGENSPSLSVAFGDMLCEKNIREKPQRITFSLRLSSKIQVKLRLARRRIRGRGLRVVEVKGYAGFARAIGVAIGAQKHTHQRVITREEIVQL